MIIGLFPIEDADQARDRATKNIVDSFIRDGWCLCLDPDGYDMSHMGMIYRVSRRLTREYGLKVGDQKICIETSTIALPHVYF